MKYIKNVNEIAIQRQIKEISIENRKLVVLNQIALSLSTFRIVVDLVNEVCSVIIELYHVIDQQ